MLKTESRNKFAINVSKQLGFAVDCMMSVPNYRQYPVAVLGLWTYYTIIHEQIQFFFDVGGEVQGYINWASILPGTLEKCVKDPKYILHPTEWNEGDIIWINDFCMKGRYRRRVLLGLVEQTFNEKNAAHIYWPDRYNSQCNSYMSLDLNTLKFEKKYLSPGSLFS